MTFPVIRIRLIPCGPAPSEVLAALREDLARELGAAAVLGKELPMPDQAYSPHCRQYLAEAFLPRLREPQESQELALAITDVDLYAPWLNFVFGLADPRSRSAIISITRLRPEFYGQPADPGLFRLRVLKEAIHELGHLLGLSHCRRPACVMFFSNSLADTDRKGPGFCEDCRGKLRNIGGGG
jgi:archaemetzincin